MNATNVGGAIQQVRLMVVRVANFLEKYWDWKFFDSGIRPRPMSNLLTPPGLLRRNQKKYYNTVRGHVTDGFTDPMPSQIGRWIKTKKGIQRLLPKELGRGLGIPKAWDTNEESLTAKVLESTTSVFHWEYMVQCLTNAGDEATAKMEDTEKLRLLQEMRTSQNLRLPYRKTYTKHEAAARNKDAQKHVKY